MKTYIILWIEVIKKEKKRAGTFKEQAESNLCQRSFCQTFLTPLPAHTLISTILFLTDQTIYSEHLAINHMGVLHW